MSNVLDQMFSGRAGFQPDTRPTPLGVVGVRLPATPHLDIVPATSYTNNLAAAATVGAGGTFTLTSGTGITSTTINGLTVYDLGTERAVTVTGAATTAAVSMTIDGFDMYQQKVTETFTGPATATTAATTKTFRYVYRITAASSTAANVTAGVNDKFGLPLALQNEGYVSALAWASQPLTSTTGFTLADTTTATATTGNVRGTYTVQGTAANGARRLIMAIMVQDANSTNTAYGVQQYNNF